MKSWKVGQRMVCDRPGRQLFDCFVRSVDVDSVVIFCPSKNTVICGRHSNLERLGWRLDDRQPELNVIDVDVDTANCVDHVKTGAESMSSFLRNTEDPVE